MTGARCFNCILKSSSTCPPDPNHMGNAWEGLLSPKTMKNGDQKGLDSPFSLPKNKEPQAIMTIARGSFCVLIKWSMRLRCGEMASSSCDHPSQNGRLSNRFSNRTRTQIFLEKFKISSKSSKTRAKSKKEIKKSPGKRISSDSYGSHYLGTMCLFAGGQVNGT